MVQVCEDTGVLRRSVLARPRCVQMHLHCILHCIASIVLVRAIINAAGYENESKALDTVNFKIITKNFGMKEVPVQLFTTCLRNRQHCTTIKMPNHSKYFLWGSIRVNSSATLVHTTC